MPPKKRSFPTKEKSYEIENKPSGVPRPRGSLLILGTSNFARHLTKFETPAPGYWLNVFEEKLQMNINLITTYTVEQLGQAVDAKAVQDEILKHQMLLVHCLGNDVRHTFTQKGRNIGGEEREKILKQTVADYVKILSSLRALYPELPLCVSLPLPRRDHYKVSVP